MVDSWCLMSEGAERLQFKWGVRSGLSTCQLMATARMWESLALGKMTLKLPPKSLELSALTMFIGP